MRNVMLGAIIMKEYVSEEEWDAVHDFFREEYRKKHPIRWWIEEIRFKFDMLTARFRKNDDIHF